VSVIAIVGGGASGIALARELDRCNKKYVIYESRQLGATWASVPADLKVLSPWWTNILDASDFFNFNPFGKPTARKYLTHLLKVVQKLNGQILEGVSIKQIESSNQGARWKLTAESGQIYHHNVVVVATGYFFSPAMPDPLFESDKSIPIVHASSIKNYSEFDSLCLATDPVLVVGGRVTAGQIMLELDRRNIAFDMSVRSEILFRRHGFFAFLRESVYFIVEEIVSRLLPPQKQNSYPAMDGGKTQELISSGVVGIHPTIKSCFNGVVEFSNGAKKKYSAIILATGYHPCIQILSGLVNNITALPPMDGFKVSSCDGIYLLGFDNLYDHRSRYLRGIRQDAKKLANAL